MAGLPFAFGTSFVGAAELGEVEIPPEVYPAAPRAALVPAVVIDWDGEGFLPGEPTGATATATSASTTEYLTTPDADAADVAVGATAVLVDSSGAYRFLRLFTVTRKDSAAGVTSIYVTPQFPWAPVAGDILRVVATNRKDVTRDVRLATGIRVVSGRDDARTLSPMAAGNGGFVLDNVDRVYSPLNTSSPLYGSLGPGLPVTWEMYHAGTAYTLFTGHLDDFQVSAARQERSVATTVLDGLARLRRTKMSTGLYEGIRTGEAIDLVLDAAGWNTDERSVDAGSTVIRKWWEDGIDAYAAIERLLASEGPPAVVYVSPTGQFVFRDRHHRLIRSRSVNSQATFGDTSTEPRMSDLELDAGWRSMVNDVRFTVEDRDRANDMTVVWESDGPIVVRDGESVEVDARASDPFIDAVTPVEDTDYTVQSGVVSLTLSRTSGQSAIISIEASGGPAVILDLQLRAFSVPVVRETIIRGRDADSVDRHGESTWPDEAPWAGVHDARAIRNIVLGRHARPRPSVRMRLRHKDLDARLRQQLSRAISDHVTITEAETGVSGAYHIERIEHAYDGTTLETVFGCEQVPAGAGDLSFTRAFVIGTSTLGGEELGSRLIDVPALVMVLGEGGLGRKVLAT